MTVDYEIEKKVIQNLLLTFKRPVSVQAIKQQYEANMGKPIPYLELGFVSLENFLLSLKDVVIARYTHEGSLILTGRADQATEHIKDLLDHQKSVKRKLVQSQRKISSKNVQGFSQLKNNAWTKQNPAHNKRKLMDIQIQQRVKSVINLHPKGLSAHDLSLCYIKEYPSYKSDMDFKGKGFATMEEFFISADADTFYVKGYSKERYFYPKVSLSSETAAHSTNDQHLWNAKNDKSQDIQDFTVKAGENYMTFNLELFKYYSKVPVMIGEIYNPFNFFILIRGELYNEALNQLYADMKEFYMNKENIEKWKINIRNVVYEHPVAVVLEEDGHLYRGIITCLRGLDEAEVYLVDFGTNCNVSRGNLLYLHRQFFDLPSQAINASLHELRYNKAEPRIMEKTSARLLELVYSKENLVATMSYVDTENCSLFIILEDHESENKVISINELLVQEKLLLPTSSDTMQNKLNDEENERKATKQSNCNLVNSGFTSSKYISDKRDAEIGVLQSNSEELPGSKAEQICKEIALHNSKELHSNGVESSEKRDIEDVTDILKNISVEPNVSSSHQHIHSHTSANLHEMPKVDPLGDALESIKTAFQKVKSKKEEVLQKFNRNPTVKKNFLDLSNLEATLIIAQTELECILSKD